jgi:SAM-dependent methyltransferase
MNIADKAAFYRELYRVLKPGGWLLLSELAQGNGAALEYPTPWAASEDASFLATPQQTQQGLRDAGFDLLQVQDTTNKARAYGAASRDAVARGEKPPHRTVMLVHGEEAPRIMANSAKALADGRVLPIEVLARRRQDPHRH